MAQGGPSPPAARGGCIVLIGLLLLACATALRVATLTHESLEGDEVFSRQVALLLVRAALSVIRQDLVHPPFYYMLLKVGASAWGSGPIGIRVWSILFGVATVLAVAFLCSRLPGARYAGPLAGAIVAVNQYEISYSQQARS